MHREIVAALRCPVCRATLAEAGAAMRCPAGHAFDVARQGYVNLLVGRAASAGDTAAMLDARAAVLGAGHFSALEAAVVRGAVRAAGGRGVVVEIGAGTARYVAAVLEGMAGRVGLALDVSKAAARRAARAHPRLDAAVADAKARWPLGDGVAAVVIGVFAPRNGEEAARVVAEDGGVVVATPGAGHLTELREAFGLLAVDPDKGRRVEEQLGAWLRRDEAESQLVRWAMALRRDEAVAVARMGPSAWHLDAGQVVVRAAGLDPVVRVTGEVAVEVWRRR